MTEGKRFMSGRLAALLQLVGKIQESYGIAKDEAERQVKDWEARNEAMFKDLPKH